MDRDDGKDSYCCRSPLKHLFEKQHGRSKYQFVPLIPQTGTIGHTRDAPLFLPPPLRCQVARHRVAKELLNFSPVIGRLRGRGDQKHIEKLIVKILPLFFKGEPPPEEDEDREAYNFIRQSYVMRAYWELERAGESRNVEDLDIGFSPYGWDPPPHGLPAEAE